MGTCHQLEKTENIKAIMNSSDHSRNTVAMRTRADKQRRIIISCWRMRFFLCTKTMVDVKTRSVTIKIFE